MKVNTENSNIEINKYIQFDVERGIFCLSDEASNMIYRQKELICSYSGADEWCNHFICELFDVYSGSSVYNHAVNSYRHEERIKGLFEKDRDKLIDWVKDSINNKWSNKVYNMIVTIIDDLPESDDN